MASASTSDPANGFRLRFVENVVSLPAVSVACNAAFQTYKNVKASNKLFSVTLNTAEKAGSFVTQKSMPVIRKFENQIKAVDDVACRGLENLVEVAPLITKPPEQVLSYGRHRCSETIQNGLNKIVTSKNYVKDLVDSEIQRSVAVISILLSTAAGQRVLHLPDHVLDRIEDYVNYYYPPLENEEPEEPSDAGSKLPPWTRVKNLSKRVEMRVSMKFEHDLQDARKIVSGLYSNVVNFDLTKSVDEFFASPFGSLLLNSVDSAFDQAGNYVDYYLPPLGDEGSSQPFGDREVLPAWRRADMLSNTLKERMYKHAMLRLQRIQLQSRETVGRVRSFNVVHFVRSITPPVSGIITESGVYASSVVQLAFGFHISTSTEQQPVARLYDLARAALSHALETARVVTARPELIVQNLMSHHSNSSEHHQPN